LRRVSLLLADRNIRLLIQVGRIKVAPPDVSSAAAAAAAAR
jgi:hypothetical protein